MCEKNLADKFISEMKHLDDDLEVIGNELSFGSELVYFTLSDNIFIDRAKNKEAGIKMDKIN